MRPIFRLNKTGKYFGKLAVSVMGFWEPKFYLNSTTIFFRSILKIMKTDACNNSIE